MRFSAIIPLYNAKEYIAEALQSLLDQQDIELEIIVVDDGSKDGSIEIVRQFPVKYYEKINGGASAARNFGLQYATGEYVMFLDADDYLRDNTICKHCIDMLENKDLDFVMFTYQYFNTQTRKYGESINYPSTLEGEYDVTLLTEKMVRCGIYPASPCFKIFKREFLENNRLTFIEGTTSEDVEWFTKVLLHTKRYGIVNNNAYIYRKGVETSVTGSFPIHKCWNFINIMKMACEMVAKCENECLQNTLYSALCYEYYILLGNSAPFMEQKEILAEMKSFQFLQHYTLFPRTNLLRTVSKLVGLKNFSKLLAYKIAHHSKSNS